MWCLSATLFNNEKFNGLNFHYKSLLNWNKVKPFFKAMKLQAMKNASHTTKMFGKHLAKRGETPQTVIKPRKVILCMCSGIWKELFTMNCSCSVKWLILTSVNNWKNYSKQSKLICRKFGIFHLWWRIENWESLARKF